MKKNLNSNKNLAKNNSINGVIPNSFRFISSCIKTVSSNVRSAGASVSGSISGDSDDHHKDQVLWACFDRLELGSSSVNRVLLLGYSNGFQVLDIEDTSNVRELVSRRDDPVTFLQMQPLPAKSEGCEGFGASHPLLLVVASDETRSSSTMQNGRDGLVRDNYIEPQTGNFINSPTAVRFYSFRSHSYVHVLRFRSAVYMVRCSPQIVAVGLASQIYCFDALTLENKFSVLTYPVPQLGGHGMVGVNIGYGPMAVGTRWLAYASNNPILSNTGRLSPQSLSPSPGVSPSTSPSSGNLVARYAMESSKQLAAGLINLGDMGYKTFSKYCHELLPDASGSPTSTNSNWKVGRNAAHSTETDIAGMVVIKDFVSRTVVSQFRAHNSPISALCFDPSGTLLVTASIHGNNINIFRIIPAYSQNGSSTQSYDWSSSHVHLYKLHRGMTSAVIQDICFSHYSQWIAIVSSKGTCHIFVLSPFGGETGLQIQNSYTDGPTLIPILSLPWWSASSLMISQQSVPPPLPVTLSVVGRIRTGNSGWLNTVSNAATSAAGKVSTSSGVVAAVFHNSLRTHLQPTLLNASALEHLLVYTPSGNVIKHELLPLMAGEQAESISRTGTGSSVQMQEEELRVKGEPVQWWDVCRRADWPEREESIYEIALCGQQAAETVTDTSDCEDNDIGETDSVKTNERSHWYLSNAEVQVRTGRIPIWQKSKINFLTMSLLGGEEQNLAKDYTGGEIEIEKIPIHEVEMKKKDLLPVFDYFHRSQSYQTDDRSLVGGKYSSAASSYSQSGLVGGSYSTTCSYSHGGKDKFAEDSVVSHPNLVSPGFVEKVVVGSPRTPAPVHGLDKIDTGKSYHFIVPTANGKDGLKSRSAILSSPPLNQSSFSRGDTLTSLELSRNGVSSGGECNDVNSPSTPKSGSLSTGKTDTGEVQPSNSAVTSKVLNTSSNPSDSTTKILDNGQVHEDVHDPLDFGQCFQEGYYKASTRDGYSESTEVVTDVDSSISPCGKAKAEEDEDNDDMLGVMFAFSEEG
ncbi:autophagy-related protein 18h-like [Cornus florida]|uniref:autophagy-related protein 18h-like n=1 Tax=Cornus florida TaxID=4283 RepID=UPI0028A029EE|nr:autophagy-related protein 18h-like [Cornus florida]